MKQTIAIIAILANFALAGGCQRTQVAAQTAADLSESEAIFTKEVKPLLIQYCGNCHEPGSMTGLDFLAAQSVDDLSKLRSMYASVVEEIESGSMPPKIHDQPTAAEKERVVGWLKKTLDLKPADTDRISNYVVETFEDSQGRLWFGTMRDGVARCDGESLTYFTKKDGLPDNVVSSIAEDKDGNIWFGTHNGVCKFDGKSFSPAGVDEGLPKLESGSPFARATVTTDRRGNVWASVARKVFRFDSNSFVEFKLPINRNQSSTYAIVAGNASLSLEDSKGNLWFGTDGFGAFKYDGKSFTQYTKQDGLCSNNVNSIVEDNSGNIWFACMQSYQPEMTGDGGVCRFDGTSFTRFPQVKGLANNDIYTMYKTSNGDFWIGATGVGAYRYDGRQFTFFNQTDRPHWTRNFGVQSILEDRNGTLWFGFSGGLFRFNGQSFLNVAKESSWPKRTPTKSHLQR